MTAITINVSDAAVISALDRLATACRDTAPAMRAIAELLARQVEDNFAAQAGPLGKWPAFKAGRRGDDTSARLLQQTGRLAASIRPFHSAAEAGIGTNVVYAAIHQFGGKTRAHVIKPRNKKALAFGGRVVASVNHPGSDIPARPYLPIHPAGRLQDGLQDEIVATLVSYIQQAAGP